MNLVIYCLLQFIDIVHGLVFLIPLLFLFGIIKNTLYFKITLAILLLVPLHWPFFNNECIFTVIANKINDTKETYITRTFLFLPEKLKKYVNIQYTSDQITKIIATFIIMSMIVVCWYIIFYKMKCTPRIEKKKNNFFL